MCCSFLRDRCLPSHTLCGCWRLRVDYASPVESNGKFADRWGEIALRERRKVTALMEYIPTQHVFCFDARDLQCHKKFNARDRCHVLQRNQSTWGILSVRDPRPSRIPSIIQRKTEYQ